MPEWKKTFCPLCYHNCGLEIQTSDHRIIKVRPEFAASKDRRGYSRPATRTPYPSILR